MSPIVKYTGEQGEQRTFRPRGSATRALIPSVIGETVDLLYDETNPVDVRLASVWDLYLLPIMFGGIAALLFCWGGASSLICVGGLNGAEWFGLGRGLEDIPQRQRRWLLGRGLFRHGASIGRAARNAPPIRRCELHTMQDDEAEKPKPCGGNRRMHLPR